MNQELRKPALVALSLGLLLLAVLTVLLCSGKIGSVAYGSLFTVSAIVCLGVYGFPRLKLVDLKNMRLELAKMETIKREIYAKEEDVKKLTLLISDYLLFASLWINRGGTNETHKYKGLWFRTQTDRILDALRLPGEARANILRYATKFDAVMESKNQEEARRLYSEIEASLKAEVEARLKEEHQ